MTERKPFGGSSETWIDRQIREGMERGSSTGCPVMASRSGMWTVPTTTWSVRGQHRREGVSYLPPTLALRKDVEDAEAAIAESSTEAEVGQIVEEINERIRSVNRMATAGPPSNLMPLDLERTLEGWSRHPRLSGRACLGTGWELFTHAADAGNKPETSVRNLTPAHPST